MLKRILNTENTAFVILTGGLSIMCEASNQYEELFNAQPLSVVFKAVDYPFYFWVIFGFTFYLVVFSFSCVISID